MNNKAPLLTLRSGVLLFQVCVLCRPVPGCQLLGINESLCTFYVELDILDGRYKRGGHTYVIGYYIQEQ
jgi:hypothetical protein